MKGIGERRLSMNQASVEEVGRSERPGVDLGVRGWRGGRGTRGAETSVGRGADTSVGRVASN